MAGTKDEKLKVDMPPTFKTVEDSTDTLVEASKGLAVDAESKPHKKMLLDGARGQYNQPHMLTISSSSASLVPRPIHPAFPAFQRATLKHLQI